MQSNNSVSPLAAMSAAELNPQLSAQLLDSDVDSDSDIDGLDNNDWDTPLSYEIFMAFAFAFGMADIGC